MQMGRSDRLFCKLNWLTVDNGQADKREAPVRGLRSLILCVRQYLRFKLSLRDLVEITAERGLSMTDTMIMRWVQH